MGENWTIHVEKSRSWWHGTSTTLCGLTITKVKVSGRLMKVTCTRCALLEQGATR
jgi:hypothetical protein